MDTTYRIIDETLQHERTSILRLMELLDTKFNGKYSEYHDYDSFKEDVKKERLVSALDLLVLMRRIAFIRNNEFVLPYNILEHFVIVDTLRAIEQFSKGNKGTEVYERILNILAKTYKD